MVSAIQVKKLNTTMSLSATVCIGCFKHSIEYTFNKVRSFIQHLTRVLEVTLESLFMGIMSRIFSFRSLPGILPFDALMQTSI